MSDPVPYREGEPAPSPAHVLAKVYDEDDESKEPELMWVDLNDVDKKAPLQHDEIESLLPVIRWQYRHLRNYANHCRSFEDWELNFLRERHPVREVVIWTQITYALLQFAHLHPKANKSNIYDALLSMSLGREDKVKPPKVLAKLKELIQNVPRALADASNFTQDGKLKVGPKHLR